MKDKNFRFATVIGGIIIFACLSFLTLLFLAYSVAKRENFPVSRLEVGDNIWVAKTQCSTNDVAGGFYVVTIPLSERVSKIPTRKLIPAYVSAKRSDHIEIVWLEKEPPPP